MSNLRARDALQRAHRLFLDRPTSAKKPGAAATALWRDGLRCEVYGPGGEHTVTDMPSAMGGDGGAPNPGWLLRASLASCTTTVIAMRAAMLGIELRALEVSVHSQSDPRGLLGIDGAPCALTDMRISVKICADGVPEAQLRELAMWGDQHSAVSCTLREELTIEVEVLVV